METTHVKNIQYLYLGEKSNFFSDPSCGVQPKKSGLRPNHLGNVHLVLSDRKQTSTYDNTLAAYEYYPFGMAMQTYETDGYRYGFNGKEKDDDWNGSGNSYDFGARIYDSRLGKFYSLDPLSTQYPYQSPYVYSSSCPIRYIDVNGEGPSDPVIFSNIHVTGNVIILLLDDGKDFDMSLFTDDDQWDIIAVSDLQHANTFLREKYPGDKKIENLVISTHGVVETGKIHLENTTNPKKAPTGTGEDKGKVAQMGTGDFNNPSSDFQKKQLAAFKGIFSHLGENAEILMSGCGLGGGDLGETLSKLATGSANTKNATVFTNRDLTTDAWTYDGTLDRFRFDEQLTSPTNFHKGWVKSITQSGVTTSTNMNKSVPVINDDNRSIDWEQTESTNALEDPTTVNTSNECGVDCDDW